MRILFIYTDYAGRRKRYGKIMEFLGYEVVYFELFNKLAACQVRKDHIKDIRPDLVWLLQPSYVANKVIDKECLDYLKKQNISLVTYFTFGTDTPYINWLKHWSRFDFLFVHNIHLHGYLKSNNLNSYYMPVGFYPDMYYPSSGISKTIPVSFMGSCQTMVDPKKDKRAIYLNALKKYGIHVYGGSFKDRVLPEIFFGDYKKHEIQRQVYHESHINLDLPFVNSSRSFYKNIYHIKNRFFEIPATCNFMLTLRCPEFLNIFDETMVGYYEDDAGSLKEMTRKFLAEPKKCQRMAEKAHKVVMEKHTFHHRFQEMFSIIEKNQA